MLVHVYREHTLRLLGMQSLCRASVSDLPHGVRQDRLVQPGGKKNPFSVRFDWAIMLPYAQTTLPEE